MKVAHVITGLGLGGAEGCLARLVLNDQEAKHVVVSLMDEGFHGETLRKAGIQLHTLGFRRGAFSIPGFFRLSRVLHQHCPDVVQTWMVHADLLGGAAAKLATRARIFWGIRNTILNPRKSPFSTRLAVKLCAPLSYILPHKIISCSAIAARDHVEAGYSASKMVVIPNGIDTETYAPSAEQREEQRRAWGIDHDTFLFGMVARFDPQKDHENLLLALEILSAKEHPWKCVLVGSEMDANNPVLEQSLLKKNLSARVVLAGPTRKIPHVMNALDCHILSSSCGEGFPNVVAEAMACGTPCVGTDVGDTALIIDSAGWVVPPSNPARLAAAMQAAIDESTTGAWEARQGVCRKFICEKFSLSKMVKSFHTAWNAQT